MSDLIPAAEMMQFLRDVEVGTITLHAVTSPDEIYAGDVDYEASNGWRIRVFNDCASWDYLDHATDTRGRELDFNDLFDSPDGPYFSIYCYRPSREVAKACYGISE